MNIATINASNDCLTLKDGLSVNPKFVPMGRAATVPAVPQTVTSQSQEPVYLKAIFLSVGAGVVDDLRIGNQSLNCSDSAIDTALFAPNQQRKNVVGVAVDGNIQMSVQVTTDLASAITGAFSCEAIQSAPSIRAQCNAINKFFGLGSVSIAPAGGTATLTATALRSTTLRDLVLSCHDDQFSAEIDVSDITIKGRSIFSGQAGDVLSLTSLNATTQGFMVGINIPIETNERVTVTFTNNHIAALIVGGGLYCD